MIRNRVWLAAASAVLTIVACKPDGVSAPTEPGVRASALLATTSDGAPVKVIMYPSAVTGASQVGALPAAYVMMDSAVSFDRTVSITTSNPAVLFDMASSATIPAGQAFINVSSHAAAVSQPTAVTVTATGAGIAQSAVVTVYPAGVTLPPTPLASISVSPGTVAAGSGATATVTLTAPAPSGGLDVLLGAGPSDWVAAPPWVTVPAGATSVSYPITTFNGFPNSTTTAEINAYAVDSAVHTGLNIVSGPATTPPALAVASLALNPSTVVGGSSSTGTVTLNAAAPSGGTVVTLQSTSTNVATVPASVTIAAGASSTSFPISTFTVTTATSSNIAASIGSGSLATTLAVNPAPAPAPAPAPTTLAAPSLVSPAADSRFPAQSTVTFDWSDVSGAASYTIQVSTTDKFTSFVANQTVTPSQATIAGLPTSTMFWRVRANAAGAPGTWSAVRRFELK